MPRVAKSLVVKSLGQAAQKPDLFVAKLPAPPVHPASIAAPSAPMKPAAPARGRMLKSGYGLCTRSGEGDDTVTPFRSLEDLLSAVKPLLRATAGSAEPVWFSIQPVDLASIDVETM